MPASTVRVVDAGRPDDDVVDVAAMLANLHGMQHAPGSAERGEFAGNLLFTLGSDPPRAFVGLHPEHASDEVPPRRERVHLVSLDVSSSAGDVRREVASVFLGDRQFNGFPRSGLRLGYWL